MSLTISDYTSISDYVISKSEQTLSSYVYNYNEPTTNIFIDHNYFVSTGIYGKFYNYDYLDLSNNIIISAGSYIQRDISISGNLYCTNLYNYLANQYVTNTTLDNRITQTISSISGIITVDLLEYTKNTTFYNYITSLSGSLNILYTNFQNLNIPIVPSDLVNKITFDLYINSLSGSILSLNNNYDSLLTTLNNLNIPVIPSDLVNKPTFDLYINSLSGSILTTNNNLINNYTKTTDINALINNALQNISLASFNPLYLGGTNGLMLQYDSTNAYIRNLNTGYLYLGVQNTNSIKITNKGLIIGNSSDGVSNSITDSQHQSNSLCIVGQGTYPNRSITMWDNVEIRGNQTINGGVIINNGLTVASGEYTLNTNQIKTASTLYHTNFNTNSASSGNPIFVFRCMTRPFYRAMITLNVPISIYFYANAFNNSLASVIFKLTGLSCQIFKNNVLWSSPLVNANYNFQYNFAIRYANVTGEIYVTMASVSFTPDVTSTLDTYDVYFTSAIYSFRTPPNSTFTDYGFTLYVNHNVNDKIIYSQSYNNNGGNNPDFVFSYTNPALYLNQYYVEKFNKPTVGGAVYMNELFVNVLNYDFLNLSTTAGININANTSSTINTNNPIFKNIYFDISSNPTPKIDFGYNDSTKAINAGNIIYNGSNSTFDIYGCGSSIGTRNIKLYDNVIISNSLTVNSTVNTINCFTSNLSSTNCITSLFTCDVLTNKNTATLGSVFINNNLGSIIPLNVGKNSNNDSLNCSGNITTNDIYCSDLYYANSINNVDVISDLFTISNQIYSLSDLINNFTNVSHNWSGNNNWSGVSVFSNTSTNFFYAPPYMSGANITPNTIKDSSLTSNVVLYNSDYILNNTTNINTLSGLINNNINSISGRINNYIISNNNNINSLSGRINNLISTSVSLNGTQTLTNKTLNNAILNNGFLNNVTITDAHLAGLTNIDYATIQDLTLTNLAISTLFCYESFFNDIKFNDVDGNVIFNISNDGTITSKGVIVTDSVFTFKNTTGATLFSVDNTGIITSGNSPNGSDNSLQLATTSYVCQFGKLDIENTWSQRQTFNIAPIMSGSQITTASIPDIALSSNIPRLNGASNVFGNLTVDSQRITSCVFTSATTYSIVSPFYETYCIGPTVNMTITLPVASASNLGVKIIIRRTSGTSTVTVNSASANIYQLNNTLSNVILPASAYLCYLNSCFLTSTTYGWFVV